MIDETELRQIANSLGRAAGAVTEQAFESGTDAAQLKKDIDSLLAATDVCRRAARRIESRRAQLDDKSPLCLGCKNRQDVPGGFACALGLDTKEATTRRSCKQYKAE
jgi:hypothetical protein